MTDHSTWFKREDHEVEVFYNITPYDPGVSWGPAEHCYPAEGGEVEILRVLLDGKEVEWTTEEDNAWADWMAQNHDYGRRRRF
jgi:hypothetical protein